MAALLEKYPATDPILDIGCGTGDLAIYLAQHGHQVVGVDFVEAAILDARRKVDLVHPEASRLLDFRVADALRPSHLNKKFGSVVDSGFYHLFDSDQCEQLVDEVAATLLPHGHYYLHEFAIELPAPNMPRQISAKELEARFTMDKGWRIKEIQSVEFLSRVAPPVPAICACIERLSAEKV
jgi:cyclopropane fatty-acyl-phospholipid synthase-like methyltransferase